MSNFSIQTIEKGERFFVFGSQKNETPIFLNLIQNPNALFFRKPKKDKFRERGRSRFLIFFEERGVSFFVFKHRKFK